MAKKNYESKIANKARNFVQVQHKETVAPVENSLPDAEPAVDESSITKKELVEEITITPVSSIPQVPESSGIIRRPGRKKELEGEYHVFAARIRQDLFDHAQQISGKNKQYQSINAYINELIWRDMNS